MTRINYWCYLQDNKITGKWKFSGEWCSLWGGYNKKQHTGKDAAFLMKFILKQYEQKSATHVFIWILPLFAIKKLHFHFLQIKISKLLLINIFVRKTHGI